MNFGTGLLQILICRAYQWMLNLQILLQIWVFTIFSIIGDGSQAIINTANVYYAYNYNGSYHVSLVATDNPPVVLKFFMIHLTQFCAVE